MDAALQASAGLMDGFGAADTGRELSPSVPFALEQLEIFDTGAMPGWVVIGHSPDNPSADAAARLDIDLCDDQGMVCVRMKGFSSRTLQDDPGHPTGRAGTLLLRPVWKDQAVDPKITSPDYEQHLVLLCEPDNVDPNSIQSQLKGARCLKLHTDEKQIEKRYETYAVKIFELIRKTIKEKPKGPVLIQIVTSTNAQQQLFSGLSGLLKSARLENPNLIGQMIQVDGGEDSRQLIEKLKQDSRCASDHQIQYQNGRRSVVGWEEFETPDPEPALAWKANGVYLITGGVGGLGLIFAQEIVQQQPSATVTLAGRSALDADKQAQIEKLKGAGGMIEYHQVDISRAKQVSGLVQL